MIRIDLGKAETQSKAGTRVSDLLGRLRAKMPGGGPEAGKSGGRRDWKSYVGLAISCAFAALPHLFVSQYKNYVTSQHELQMQKYREREDQLKAEIAKFQGFQKELESYEKQKKIIKERLQLVQNLLESRNTPVSAFDAIAQSLPDKSWLSNIELKMGAKPSIAISGSAYSNEEISDYVDKLSESIQLKDVNLDSVSSVKLDGDLEVKQFQIAAVPGGQLVPPVKAVSP